MQKLINNRNIKLPTNAHTHHESGFNAIQAMAENGKRI